MQEGIGAFMTSLEGPRRALHVPGLPRMFQLTRKLMWKWYEVAALGGHNKPGAPDQCALLPRPVHWVNSPSFDIRLKVSSSEDRTSRLEFGLLGLWCSWRGRFILPRFQECCLLLQPALVVLARMLPTAPTRSYPTYCVIGLGGGSA